jgi:hypothetical protein
LEDRYSTAVSRQAFDHNSCGSDHATRTLRRIVAEAVWERQMAMWGRLVNRDTNGGEINP